MRCETTEVVEVGFRLNRAVESVQGESGPVAAGNLGDGKKWLQAADGRPQRIGLVCQSLRLSSAQRTFLEKRRHLMDKGAQLVACG